MNKKLLTIALGMLCGTSAFAQVEFVDANGTVIPNGSTVIRNEIETALEIPNLGKKQIIHSNISIKNTSVSEVSNIKTQLNVTDLPFGQTALCCPANCWITIGDFKVSYPTHKPVTSNLSEDGPWTSPSATKLGSGMKEDLKAEWVLSEIGSTQYNGEIGEFTATYSILVNGQTASTINVKYTTDPNATSIAGTAAGSAKTAEAYYNAAGQMVNSVSKGVYIVKYTDGTTKKVIIK